MTTHSSRILLAALSLTAALGLIVCTAADAAKARKGKRTVAATTSSWVVTQPRSSNSSNDVWLGAEYMGSDPDPNIRGWFYKDLSGRWGGSY